MKWQQDPKDRSKLNVSFRIMNSLKLLEDWRKTHFAFLLFYFLLSQFSELLNFHWGGKEEARTKRNVLSVMPLGKIQYWQGIFLPLFDQSHSQFIQSVVTDRYYIWLALRYCLRSYVERKKIKSFVCPCRSLFPVVHLWHYLPRYDMIWWQKFFFA